MDLFGSWRGRTTDIVVLTLLYLGGAAMCALVALFPPFPDTPVAFARACTAASLAGASIIWFAGRHWRAPTIHGALVFHILVSTALLALSASAQGAVTVAFIYVWVALYVGTFSSLRVARGYVAFIVTMLATGTALNIHLTGPIAVNVWVVGSVTTATGTEVYGRLLQRLQRLTTIDPLTGAYNRTGFELIADRARATARRQGESIALAVVDLDDFKHINDAQGHAVGDTLLAQLVKGWQAAIRPSDTIIRYGGDEFVVLMPGTSAEEVPQVLERMRGGSPVKWTAGWTDIDPDEPLETAIDRADRSMYSRKSGGAPRLET